MRHLEASYSDVMRMPTYQRRFFLGLLSKTAEKRQEQIEEAQQKAKGKKTLGGEALKAKIKSGQIPSQ